MVVGEASINNIMSGIESTGGVRLHNHRKKLKQRFDIIKKLGQGTYGKVQLGINKETGQEVAIKTIKKCKIETEADLIRIRREIQIMSSVQHPNIIHIYEVFENREKMVLVMEYAAGGELYDYLSERKVLAELEARRIFRQIAIAVYYCHKHKICHRDLKLENILLDENGNAKIADFGLSNVFDDTRLLATFCGSPLYASPEIVKGTPYHGPEVDCWSLGVLLYTLVYGAMPFDGSNFKRLVKQISQGDYFEPKTPSPASPLIREMLTVAASRRADMEKICAHWWVNEGHDDSCLDIAEELANQTPVRLDLLLSLVPPPPEVGSDKLVIANPGNANDTNVSEATLPTRSLSAGSIMDSIGSNQQKMRDLVTEEVPSNISSPKRKLEVTVSTENANQQESGGAKRKERSRKKDRDSSSDRRVSNRSASRNKDKVEETPPEMNELQKNLTQTMSVEENHNGDLPIIDDQQEGAMCTELIEEANRKSLANKEKRKSVKIKKPKEIVQSKIVEEPEVESLPSLPPPSLPSSQIDKENEASATPQSEVVVDKIVPEKKVTKKKVLSDKNENTAEQIDVPKEVNEKEESKSECEKPEEVAEPPTKPVERRRSKIFETAEKFQNMANATEPANQEKPKKIFIPGVNVGGFKQAFERKASLTNSTPIKISQSKKTLSSPENSNTEEPINSPDKTEDPPQEPTASPETEAPPPDEKREKMKQAVSIISNAIDREGARKSKSRPTMIRKPPVPFGVGGRSASGGIASLISPISPPSDGKRLLKLQVGPEMRTASVQVTTPEDIKYITDANEEDTKKSSLEVSLKSATLPRRKTSKAEITLTYPQPKPATMEFKTEMQHRIDNTQPRLKTQRSEVVFPVSTAPKVGFRSNSLEPETKEKNKERIIPIAFEREEQVPSGVKSPPTKPPAPRISRPFGTPRAGSMSRQSTLESDSESASTEPIKKSPREYIIPIAVEGGGYITPRAGSLEPSESGTPTSKFSGTRFGRPRRMTSLLSDRDGSEDESPFSTLHRHSSIGRDSDNEDSRKDHLHLHRLRSSRPTKRLDHADSLSSGEEDDDDGFELLTAENLFSTLLSRVRSLTQRLNVEDGGRPGFPSSRLLSHFGRDNFWDNLHKEPFRNSFGRSFSREKESPSTESTQSGISQAPWRRAGSATRFQSDFGDNVSHTLPRDPHHQNTQDLDFSDLDLANLKISDKDAIALSYLTPGLSRRIKKQLLSQLHPSQARKISRTHSMQHKTMEEQTSQTNDGETKRRASEGIIQPELVREVHEESRSSPKPQPEKINPKTEYLSRRTVSHDPTYKSYSDSLRRERLTSPFSESSEFTDISSRSDGMDPILPGIHNSDLSESDRRLLENYRKQREHRRAIRSNSLLDSSRSSYYKPPPRPEYSTDSEKSVLSKYLNYSEPKSYNSDYLKSRTLDRRSVLDRSASSTTPRRVSRFLRPDFYDTPASESIFVKEKSEREVETQKVLKEIREKRLKKKLGLREPTPTDSSISTASVDVDDKIDVAATKSKIAKLIRPKSFPEKKISPPKELPDNVVEEKVEPKSNKNKFLHSLEKKFEKLRSFSSTPSDSTDTEKVSRVTSAIRRLREQSLPRTTEHITESGLIKRAVSVEDLSIMHPIGSNPKVSRNSVSKILNLFKKIEDKDPKEPKESKVKKVEKKKSEKATKIEKATKSETDKEVKETKKLVKKKIIGETKSKSKIPSKPKFEKSPEPEKIKEVQTKPIEKPAKVIKRKETNKNRSPSAEPSDDSTKKVTKPSSKLPVFRRSVDLGESSTKEQSPIKEVRKSLNLTSETKTDIIAKNEEPRRSLNLTSETKTDAKNEETNLDFGKDNSKRKSLQLDLSKLPRLNLPVEDKTEKVVTTVDENLLSPRDDSSDHWSTSSPEYNDHSYVHSQLSPSDDNESVIDRIRRKSFYSRFNEKRKIRKSGLVGPSADYNNLSYKTVPRRSSSSLKDDKIHLEPLSAMTFRAVDSSENNDSGLVNKNLIVKNTLRTKTENIYGDGGNGNSVVQEVVNSVTRTENINSSISPANSTTVNLNTTSDANCNVIENNNDQPDH